MGDDLPPGAVLDTPSPQTQLPPGAILDGPQATPTPYTTYSLSKRAGFPMGDEYHDGTPLNPGTDQGYGSTGHPLLTPGVVAVNPSVYPIGTILRDAQTGEAYLAADKHGNSDPNVVDIYTPPGQYKGASGTRNFVVVGQAPSIPTTPEGVKSLLSQYGTVPVGPSAVDTLAAQKAGLPVGAILDKPSALLPPGAVLDQAPSASQPESAPQVIAPSGSDTPQVITNSPSVVTPESSLSAKPGAGVGSTPIPASVTDQNAPITIQPPATIDLGTGTPIPDTPLPTPTAAPQPQEEPPRYSPNQLNIDGHPVLGGGPSDISQREQIQSKIDGLKYNTPLSPEEEAKFQEWKAKYAPKDSGEDYDLRGAFKEGLTPDPQTGHWPDTYKKPNEPTFSDQSQYAKDRPDLAGHWDDKNNFVLPNSQPQSGPSQTPTLSPNFAPTGPTQGQIAPSTQGGIQPGLTTADFGLPDQGLPPDQIIGDNKNSAAGLNPNPQPSAIAGQTLPHGGVADGIMDGIGTSLAKTMGGLSSIVGASPGAKAMGFANDATVFGKSFTDQANEIQNKNKDTGSGYQIGSGIGQGLSLMAGGLPTAVGQMAAQAFGDTYAQTHDVGQATVASLKAAPEMAAYWLLGGAASKIAQPILRNFGPGVQTLGGALVSSIANAGTSAAIRGVDGQPLRPTVAGTTQDILFGVLHGIGSGFEAAHTEAMAKDAISKASTETLQIAAADPQFRKTAPYRPSLIDDELARRAGKETTLPPSPSPEVAAAQAKVTQMADEQFAPQSTAPVATPHPFLTSGAVAFLKGLGYTEEQVQNMNPSKALQLLKDNNFQEPVAQQVPAFISKAVEQQLADLGYPKDVVAKMTPADAQKIIGDNKTHQAPESPAGPSKNWGPHLPWKTEAEFNAAADRGNVGHSPQGDIQIPQEEIDAISKKHTGKTPMQSGDEGIASPAYHLEVGKKFGYSEDDVAAFLRHYDQVIKRRRAESGTEGPPTLSEEAATPTAAPQRTVGLAQRTYDAAGLDVQPGEGWNIDEARARGKALLDAGADPEEIINKIQNDQAITPDEGAVIRVRREQLGAEKFRAQDAAEANPSDEKLAQAAEDAKAKELDFIQKAKGAGTDWHDLGVTMQGDTDVDLGSVSAIKDALEKVSGRPPTKADIQKAKEVATKVGDYDKQIADLKAKLAKALAKPEGSKPPKTDRGIRIWSRNLATGAKARIAARRAEGRFNTGLDPEDLADHIIVGTDHIIQGAADFGDWSAKMVKDFGDYIKPQLKEIFDRSQQAAIDARAGRAAKSEQNAIYQHAKENYIDKGETDISKIASKTSEDLGISKDAVIKAIAGPKGKKISDEMYALMSKRRQAVSNANAWIKSANKAPIERVWKRITDLPFGIMTVGHAVGMTTHAGTQVLRPEAWSNWARGFVHQWRFLVDGGYHEKMMQSLEGVDDPTQAAKFNFWKRNGLAIDPNRVYDPYQDYSKQMGGKVGAAGSRTMDALKVFRFAMAQKHWENFPANLKTPEMASDTAKQISSMVNRGSGDAEYLGGESNRWLFAAKLEASRWARVIGDPIKAGTTVLTWSRRTPQERHMAWLTAQRAATWTAAYAATLAANQAVLSALGSKQKINATLNPLNPNFARSDWLHYKAGGMMMGPPGGILGPIHLMSQLLAAAVGPEDKIYGKNREQRATDDVKNYALGKLSPVISLSKEAIFGTNFIGQPVPWSKNPGTPAKPRLTWEQYLASHGPIASAEAMRTYAEGLRDNGMPESHIQNVIHTVESLAGAILGNPVTKDKYIGQ